MSVYDLSTIFNAVADTSFDAVKDFVAENILNFLILGVGAKILEKRVAAQTKKALLDGSFSGDEAVYGETIYEKTSKLNTLTGNFFSTQRIRNYETNLSIEQFFSASIRNEMVELILKAKKHCTVDEPIVWQHLHKVVKPKDLERTKEIIENEWRSYFSQRLNKGAEIFAYDKNPDGYQESFKLPLLIYEPSARMKRFRIILFTPEQLNPQYYPDPRDVLVEVDGQFQQHPQHENMKRLKTMQTIMNIIHKPDNKWLRDSFLVFHAVKDKEHAARPNFH